MCLSLSPSALRIQRADHTVSLDPTPSCPMTKLLLHHHVAFVTLNEPVLIQLLTEVRMSLQFPQFLPHFLFFSVWGSHPGHHMAFRHSVSQGSSENLWQVLRFFLLLVTWAVLRSTGQGLCDLCLSWDVSGAHLLPRLGSWIWGRKTSEVKCHCYHSISRGATVHVT